MRAANRPDLLFEEVTKRYSHGLWKKRRALDALSLEVAPGMSLGLIGPNGAGKSTLLRLAAGIEAPGSGRVTVFGAPASSKLARRHVGYAPEGFPFPNELRAFDALDLIARLAGIAGGERRGLVAQGLDDVGLTQAAKVRLGAFSGGMRRRFVLAQAFFHRPDLVLLDEPTVGLDAPGFEALVQSIEAARARGATLVCASHVPGLLRSSCEELLVLVDGRTQQRGRPGELLGSQDDLATLARLYSSANAR